MIRPWVAESPTMVYLYPTLLCNLKCKMCYSGSHQDKKRAESEELSLDEYKKLIDCLYMEGVRGFDISGGEPFLRDDIFQIIEYIKSYPDTSLFIVCNGTKLSDVIFKLEKCLNKIDRLHISFDSHIAKEHNEIRNSKTAFEDAQKGLAELFKSGYRNIGMNFVAMDENCRQVKPFLDMAYGSGAKYVNILRLMDVSSNGLMLKENLNSSDIGKTYVDILDWIVDNKEKAGGGELEITFVLPGYSMKEINKYRQRRKAYGPIKFEVQYDPLRGCQAFGNSLAITALGDVTGCTAMVNVPEFYIGNIRKNLLNEILRKWPGMRKKLRMRETELEKQEQCEACSYWSECRGGCPVAAFRYHGTMEKPDPTCIVLKNERIIRYN